MDSYRIPTKSGASEYVDKRSRFLGLVRPVGSEDEARTIIAACKKQYHDARHNCWCYLLRDGTERYSDDGEPQGTAGIPMLEVFRRAGVTNVVCVVTRYFGGVLLGTGGLLRAYTAAAADALADAGISEVRRWLACEVSTPYALYEPVRAAVAALGGVVQETQYAAAVTVCALLPEEAGEAFAALREHYPEGISLIRKEFHLLGLSKLNYSSYQTYGWQATTGSEEARQQAQFVSRFFDIYENSFK